MSKYELNREWVRAGDGMWICARCGYRIFRPLEIAEPRYACDNCRAWGYDKPKPNPEECCRCRFWGYAIVSDRCACLFNPPVHSSSGPVWPETHATDWCGKFEPMGDE